MRRAFIPAAVLVAMLAAPAQAQDTADARLSALTDQWYDRQLADLGQITAADGSTTQGDRLPSVTPEANRLRAQYAQVTLARLDAIDPSQLSPRAAIDAEVFRTLLETDIGNARLREWEMPFDSDSNFWSYLASPRGFTAVEDYDRYIARMRELPRYFAEQQANARAGLARGFSVPRVTLEGRDASLATYVTDDPERSPFWKAFTQIPERFSAADRERLKREGRAAIAEAATPAYAEFLRFFREEYLPQTRTTLGAELMPDGAAYYQQNIREYTTLDLTAEQIHQIGLDEVARITAEMEAVKAEAGFGGTLAEFIHFLRSDPQFVARSGDELMGVSAYVAKRVDGKIADYFGFLPRHRFTIRPVDPAIAPFYTAGRGGRDACQMNTTTCPHGRSTTSRR
ncbi:MAG: DUF885 family protein [Erythrobacter sp.]|jgi:uncharacterized protein (DUF885 family)